MDMIAVIADGTAAHERGVYIVKTDNDTDALNTIGDFIIKDYAENSPELGECSKGEIENHCSPTYEMDILNGEGSIILSLHTAPAMTIPLGYILQKRV
jgi:hypothetical protein